IHRPLVWHDVSVFTAHRTKRSATEKRKDGSQCFALLVPELLELDRFDLLPRKEFEQARELLSVKSAIDISKASRFSGWRSGNTRFFLSHGIKKIEGLAISESLHVPVS